MASKAKFGGVALAPQVGKDVVRSKVLVLAQNLKANQSLYKGGLAAEKSSAKALNTNLRHEMRKVVIGGWGRKIDLVALLSKQDKDKKPIWVVVDPTRKISPSNGQYEYACLKVASARSGGYEFAVKLPHSAFHNFQAEGVPPLPPKARNILTNEKIRKHANWVGVLYQPLSWTKINPDPAVVVEWKDLPGEYFVLAVWGGDRAEIMEFVG